MTLPIMNLGVRSEVEILRHTGSVESKEGYTVISSPHNPTYHWGNFLLFAAPPADGVYENWKQTFFNEFGHDSDHVAIGWDATEPGDPQAFLADGYELVDDVTLCLQAFTPRTLDNPQIELRAFSKDTDWIAAVELQIKCSDGPPDSASFRTFIERSFQNYRDLQVRGHGHWWGAFADGELVCDMGLYFDATRALARFQRVETHPDYRRKGICSHLLSHVIAKAIEEGAPEQFVICTDRNNPARKVYEGLGFKFHSRYYGLSKSPLHASNDSHKPHVVFKRSLPSESETLSNIAIRSKAYWGHSQEQLEKWRPGLSISKDYIEQNIVHTLWDQDRPVGFFSIAPKPPALLDHLWILPSHIGKGYGKQALARIQALAGTQSIPELTIISDPNTEGFYLRHGAIRISEVHSEPQDRILPKLLLAIR